MEAQLTFGEYMRRLRRGRKWNLTTLSEATGISYSHLSRLENDSTLPSAESVARLAEPLGGDLRAMLEMADCLPQVILDRISSQEQQPANSLKRTAGTPGGAPDADVPAPLAGLVAELKLAYNLAEDQATAIARAVGALANIDPSQRWKLIRLITDYTPQEGEDTR